jgi:hypothetical protein
VDLWLEDDFNAPSRMPAGVPYGRRENVAWSGKERADANVAVHSVQIRRVPPRAPRPRCCDAHRAGSAPRSLALTVLRRAQGTRRIP